MKKKTTPLEFQMTGLYTPRGDQRRTQILNAVIDLIAAGEATDLSLERVARTCKIRRSLVVYYFKTPEKLLRSAVEYAMSFGQQYAVTQISLAATASDRLTAFVDANFQWFQEHPQHAAVFGLMNYLATSHAEYRKLHSALAEMAEKRIEAILLGGPLKSGKKKQVRLLASVLRAHLVGILARHFTGDHSRSWDDDRGQVLASFFKLCELVWEN